MTTDTTKRVLTALARCVTTTQALAADPDDTIQWGQLRGQAAWGEGGAYAADKDGIDVPSPGGPTPSTLIGTFDWRHPLHEVVTILDRLHANPGNTDAWIMLRGRATGGSLEAFERAKSRA